MRAWMTMFVGLVACAGDGAPEDSGSTTTTTTTTTPRPTKGEAVLEREGEFELRGADWTGTERLHLYEDDLFEPVDVCIITYTVTGTKPVDSCAECNGSPEGNGGAHSFVISDATIETELYEGACSIVLGVPTVDVATLEALNGAALIYGWGEEPTAHGYALYQMDDKGAWFLRETMRYPWENGDGVLDDRGVDAYMAFSLFEGAYAF